VESVLSFLNFIELQFIANKFYICRFSVPPFGCLSPLEKTHLSQDKVGFLNDNIHRKNMTIKYDYKIRKYKTHRL